MGLFRSNDPEEQRDEIVEAHYRAMRAEYEHDAFEAQHARMIELELDEEWARLHGER